MERSSFFEWDNYGLTVVDSGYWDIDSYILWSMFTFCYGKIHHAINGKNHGLPSGQRLPFAMERENSLVRLGHFQWL